MSGKTINAKVRLYTVPADGGGQRLDNLLLRELKGVPRSLVYRLVRKGQVRINGGRCKPLDRVKPGDEVRIPPVRLSESAPKPAFKNEDLASIRDRIIDEDSNYLAVDKPAGMAVHAGTGINWGLIDLLRAARPEASLELVHRTDRGTSGVLLLAKHRSALLAAQSALRANEVKKRYLCLLMGRLPEQRIEVNAPLSRVGGRDNSRVIVDGAGKQAFTVFVDLEKIGENTFAEASIKTGRTHQVRVHAAHIGHPLLGDGQYGGPKLKGLERPALHCASMDLPGDDAGRFSFIAQAPLADDMRRTVEGRRRKRQK